ncbi:hypothetical protein BDQ12DRAFT_659337 [Crucibulum laeve]|uniref:Uncharacterized protein n=1 Tax=Crucibulum laeve TaxID=68775 RepID=A0A5C3LHU3_9AGAR|nr:hypothetical protein BDQ12DRAFT_659337 [Crucibulum laeve]
MAAPTTRGFGSRGTTMAVTCVGAVGAFLGASWVMGKDVKSKEGAHSPYSNGEGSDKAMTSSDVSAAVSVPKPGKERIPGAIRKVE